MCLYFVETVGDKSRLRAWRDVGEGDIKIFLANLIAMGLVRKGSMPKYWDHGETVKTSFFGTYMGRNTFQSIMSNLQVSDANLDVPRNNPHHDPLFKVCPFMDMLQKNFKRCYKPGRDLSFDEGCCPFKGHLKFRCYNPRKPAKFHIKMFEVSDSKTGYVIGFDVYTGKKRTDCYKRAQTLDPKCTDTTKTVVGLLQSCNLVDKGHHVYMDNYYGSPELFSELHYLETLCCGTVRGLRKNLPKAVTKAKLKDKGECVFRRNGPLLCFAWKEKKKAKKNVLMLTTIHEAVLVETGKMDMLGNKVEKPEAVYYYCGRMGGVDLSDQLLNYYSFLRKSTKWSRKLLIHMLNLLILNAYILNKHYGCEKLTHDEYRDRIVKYLLEEGLKNYKIPLPPVMSKRIGKYHGPGHDKACLCERHFPSCIPKGEDKKRERPSRCCFVCSHIPGYLYKKKRTSYWCEDCRKPLCVVPCFKIYHTEMDFQKYGQLIRGGVMAMEGDDGGD